MREQFSKHPTPPEVCALGVAFSMTAQQFAEALQDGLSDYALLKQDECLDDP